MIVKIIKKQKVCGNEKYVYELLDIKGCVYAGPILTNNSIRALKQTGITCINYNVYKEFSEKRLLKEIKCLSNEDCEIEVINPKEKNPTVIIRKKSKEN